MSPDVPVGRPRSVAGLIVIMVSCALTLSSCALPRSLPDRAEPNLYAGLDVCALVPVGELRADHPEIEVKQAIQMPPTCNVSPNDTGDVVIISEVGEPAPATITELGQDGVTEEHVEGGLLLHRSDELEPCRSYAIADNGVWLMLNAHGSTDRVDRDPSPQLCEFLRTVAAASLRTLARSVPTIDWPQDSLYRKDICELAQSSGLLPGLAAPGRLTAGPSRLTCQLHGLEVTDPIRFLTVEATVGNLLPSTSAGVTEIAMAGQPATVRDSRHSRGEGVPGHVSCTVSVALDSSAHWSRQAGRTVHEVLRISVHAHEPYDCQTVVAAATGLVEALV